MGIGPIYKLSYFDRAISTGNETSTWLSDSFVFFVIFVRFVVKLLLERA